MDSKESEARVDRVFAAVGRMSEIDLLTMRRTWDEGDAQMRANAWLKVRAALRDDPRSRILADAQDRLATWVGQSNMTWLGGANTSPVTVSAGIE